jgi:hypothetical protein
MIGQYGLADLGSDRYAYLSDLTYVVRCEWADGLADSWVDSRWQTLADATARRDAVRAWKMYHGQDLRVSIEDLGTEGT